MKTTLIVMTLNEIDGMKAIMPQVDRAWCDQILVVDGGSTDGTIEWARENGYEVYVQKQKGIRNGYLEAWHLVRTRPKGIIEDAPADSLPPLPERGPATGQPGLWKRFFGNA